MARYGARNAMWAPYAAEKPDVDPKKLPLYSEAKTFGELNKVTDNLNFIEGTQHGDDAIALYAREFKDGTVDAESVYIPLADAATMLGAKTDSKNGLTRSVDDKPPYIGYGFLTKHLSRDKTYWQVVFYPKLKAMPGGSSTYDTRGDNINFATDKLQFHVEATLCGSYKIEKDFDTEEAATAYRDGLFTGASVPPGFETQATGT